MPAAGLKTIILLSFVLALSFLLIILSCALWANWLPLLDALVFLLTPIPNWIASRCAPGSDFLEEDGGSFPLDLGHFLTSILLVTGFAMPLAWAHAGIIAPTAAVMCAVGGFVGYATIIVYSHFFSFQIAEY